MHARKYTLDEIKKVRIAIPGTLTTAYLTLKLFCPDIETVVVDFDKIIPAVVAGEYDAGLLIHEGQLTYGSDGLSKVLDVGQWWREQTGLPLEELPRRIECFDISHIQGAETVASMVVWEDGAMKKADYRKFQVKTVTGVDDFASMREVVQRRYTRLLADKKPFPSLILIDGGLGQLSSAAAALSEIGVTLQPLASIAKREEIIYVHGHEDEPVVLDRRSPVLHLVQKIRDESHRFAVIYHRKRRQMRDRENELDAIPGIGPRTRQRLLEHFGSIRGIKQAKPDALTAVVSATTAAKIRTHFAETPELVQLVQP